MKFVEVIQQVSVINTRCSMQQTDFVISKFGMIYDSDVALIASSEFAD